MIGFSVGGECFEMDMDGEAGAMIFSVGIKFPEETNLVSVSIIKRHDGEWLYGR